MFLSLFQVLRKWPNKINILSLVLHALLCLDSKAHIISQTEKRLVEIGSISHFHCPLWLPFYHAKCGHKGRENPDIVNSQSFEEGGAGKHIVQYW